MKLAVIAFTRAGSRYAVRIKEAMEERGDRCEAYGKGKEAAQWGVCPVEESLRDWTERAFRECGGLIFIGAAGIAVRAVAPFVKSKALDPAVLCMDEQGHFVISLLSGHLGGANELARTIAAELGALPVITTATDAGGRFSVDDFARRENLYLDDLKLAKEIAADVLEQRTIGLYSDFEFCGPVPPELSVQSKGELGISISLDETYDPFPKTLHLVPKITVLGIGCKKGTPAEKIEALVRSVMEQNQISMHSIVKAASIDLKKEEPGLLEFCRKHQIPLLTYTAEELSETEHEEELSESEFVKQVTGVGSVCERSALRASGRKKLLQGKAAADGVTLAVALEKYTVNFG